MTIDIKNGEFKGETKASIRTLFDMVKSYNSTNAEEHKALEGRLEKLEQTMARSLLLQSLMASLLGLVVAAGVSWAFAHI
jgi:hypothetical protein